MERAGGVGFIIYNRHIIADFWDDGVLSCLREHFRLDASSKRKWLLYHLTHTNDFLLKIFYHLIMVKLSINMTNSRVQDPFGKLLSTELPTDYHLNNIELSVRWCVWKVGEGFPGQVLPKTLKWVAVYSIWHSTSMNNTATGWPCVCILWRGGVSCPISVYCDGVGCHVLCLYTVTGWGVMSYVCILWRGGVSCHTSCGMAFLCGSTLVKVPLLQAGTVAIWPQMFKHKQTNKMTLTHCCLFFFEFC